MGDVAERIRKQVCFYFSDSNIVRDNFLKAKVAENADGWVPLGVIASFKRMTQLTTDPEVVAEALRTADPELIELSDDGKNVRRVKPIPGTYDATPCTLYAKGFPTDIQQTDIEAFWNGVSNKVKAVRIRRYVKDNEKIQKPSCFVEFADEAERDRVVGLELKHNESPLLLESKSAYQERKKAEQKAKWAEKKKTQQPAEQPTAELIQFNVNGEDVQANVEDVKRCFSAYGTVKWVHYNRGETEGHVQVTSEAKAMVDKMSEEKPKLADKYELTLRALEEAEAAEFVKNNPVVQRGKSHKGQQGNRRSFRGQKRDLESSEGGAAAKAQKTGECETQA